MSGSEGDVVTRIETRPDGSRVARVVIDRPAKLNVLDAGQVERLAEAFRDLAADDALRVVILTGGGDKAFIGGADLNHLVSLEPRSAGVFITSLHQACQAIRDLPVPVIARINGYCLGGGLEVAAACDLRVAVDGAVFGMPEVKVGIPSVIEAALLPRLVGWGKTRELVYTGETIDAAEAWRIGFIGKLVPATELDEAVERWVAAICEAGPRAIRLQKALIARWEALPLQQAIEAGIEALSEAYRSDEPARMMRAFFAARRGGGR